MQRTDRGDRADIHRLERLLEVGPALTSELDLPSVLDLILETARELTGAQYAALGILDARRRELAQFLTAGIDDDTRAVIGALPRGHGILGLLIDRPEPIRLHDVSQHPRSYGFPPGHPPMRSFLGFPITIRGEVWGNLYLTEKRDGLDFDDADIDTARILSRSAAVAINNANLFSEASEQRVALERAVRAMHTTMDIAMAVGDDTDLSRNLEVMVTRGRELVGADALLIWLIRGDELHIAASAGNAEVPVGSTIPLDGSTAGGTIVRGRSIRVEDARAMLIDPAQYGMARTSSMLLVPLMHRERGLGVLMAFGNEGSPTGFDADAQRTLEAFAVSAGNAVAIARSVESQRLHETLAAAESERRRWARELHDETLQGMASLKLSLALALRVLSGEGRPLVEVAVDQLSADIAGLRSIIADLRPPTLDELGLEPALRELVNRVTEAGGLTGHASFETSGARFSPSSETIAYRVAQEALTNVVRHANAATVSLHLGRLDRDGLRLVIEDDGIGLADRRPSGAVRGEGYGIVGMQERAELGGGTVSVVGLPAGGTRVTLELPVD